MHPRQDNPARDKSGGKPHIRLVPVLHSSQRGADWRYLHQTPASSCSPAMCCCESVADSTNSYQFRFASHRAAFFFLFRRCPTQPHILPETPMSHHYHTTTHTTHTTQKIGNPPSGLPLFRHIQPNPTRGGACFRAAFSSPSATTLSSQKSADRASLGWAGLSCG